MWHDAWALKDSKQRIGLPEGIREGWRTLISERIHGMPDWGEWCYCKVPVQVYGIHWGVRPRVHDSWWFLLANSTNAPLYWAGESTLGPPRQSADGAEHGCFVAVSGWQ